MGSPPATALPAEADVVVVGAGLAGLACARHLHRAGLDVLVLEAGDAVGGRVRTDVVDGFRCDRGFQLLNPAYPEVQRVLDVAKLDLRTFQAGVVVAIGNRRWRVADPRRVPGAALSSVLAPVGTAREKAALLRWALGTALRNPQRQLREDDVPYSAELDAAGVTGRLRTSVLEPFLAGVLGTGDGGTSARLVRLLVRSFVLGSPGLPAAGIQAVPELLAQGLAAGCVHLGIEVTQASGSAVRTSSGPVRAGAVVVATDPLAAASLTGVPAPPMNALTTFWHAAEQTPARHRMLHLDGDRRGPVVNTAVVSDVAPSYSPDRRALVASTVLGRGNDSATERTVRDQLRLVYGEDPGSWELVRTSTIAAALPFMPPPLQVRRPVDLGGGLFVAGDHRDTPSQQGALVSGRRAAQGVLARLGAHPPAA